MKKILVPTMLVGSLCALSACGGGGGGSTASTQPAAAAFQSFSSAPRDGSYVMSGKAITASYTANTSTGTVAVSSLSGPNPATVTLTNSGGDVVAEAISAQGSSASFDLRKGDKASSSGYLASVTTADGKTSVAQADPTYTGDNYQNYGAWLTGYDTGSGTLGVASVGAQTPASGVPTSGSASYTGYSVGFARDSAGTPYLTGSNVKISTDFKTVNMTSSGTEIGNLNTDVTSSASQLDFTGTGNVSGSGFTANVSGGTVAGTANGTFYGPNAQEVGGTFQTAGGGYTYVGAFGGH